MLWLRQPTFSSRSGPSALARTLTTRARLRQDPSLLPILRSANNLQLPKGPWDGSFHDARANALSHDLLSFKTFDNFSPTFGNQGFPPDAHSERVIPFFLEGHSIAAKRGLTGAGPIGFLRESVYDAFRSSTDILFSSSEIPFEFSERSLSFATWVACEKSPQKTRSSAIENVLHHWKAQGLFQDILNKQSSENFPVYASKLNSFDKVEFTIDRPALPLFGFPNYGSMMIVYFTCPDTQKAKIWVSRRSLNKPTFPGMLDVTAGGGLAYGSTSLSTILAEAHQEAHLDETYVRERIRSTGFIEFNYRNPKGCILPGVYFTFELQMEDDPQKQPPPPRPHDGEVDTFELMDEDEVLQNLIQGKFKGSSAMVMIQFLAKRGRLQDFVGVSTYL